MEAKDKKIADYSDKECYAYQKGYENGLREQGSPRADAEIRLADEEYAKKYRKAWIEDSREIKLFKDGKKAGAADVVSDIVKLMDCRIAPDTFATRVCNYCKAQLKEWGLEDGRGRDS